MALESKKRLDSLISFVNTQLGINATDITEAMQALLDEEGAIIDRSIKKINNHKVTHISMYAFCYCQLLESVVFPWVTYIDLYAFYHCLLLESVDFPNGTNICSATFAECINLKKVILRRDFIVYLDSTNAFTDTPIASGKGYIYVPRSLVDSYKTATNWVQFADQIRALEDYTVDGTIRGALDESKI